MCFDDVAGNICQAIAPGGEPAHQAGHLLKRRRRAFAQADDGAAQRVGVGARQPLGKAVQVDGADETRVESVWKPSA